MNPAIKYLLCFCCVALLYACNPAKQLQHKQEAALNTVLASKPLLDKAGKQWSELNPCINDTASLIFLAGDTTYKHDTTTLTQVDTVTKTTTVTKVIHEKETIRDTVVKYIQDVRQLRMLQKENQTLNDSLIHINSDLQALISSEKELGYSARLFLFALLRQWWFWVAIVLSALWFFRNPIISFVQSRK